MKRCKKCSTERPFDDFYIKKGRGGKEYRRGTCKTCHIKETKLSAKQYSQEDYIRKIRYLYGISREEYLLLFEKQNGLCAICCRDIDRKLCVDHCHKTKKVRGLLCHNCNRALGLIGDDPETAKRMLNYLLNNLL